MPAPTVVRAFYASAGPRSIPLPLTSFHRSDVDRVTMSFEDDEGYRLAATPALTS